MSDSSDERLNEEIEAALDGVNLQELDLGGGGQAEKTQHENLVKGTVVGVTPPDVILELGPRSQGVCPLAEFDEEPAVGSVHDFTLAGHADGLSVLSMKGAMEIRSWMELERGSNVKCRVTGVNTGGLEVRVGSHRGFIPASQAAMGRIEDLSTMLNETLVCEVMEIDRSRNKLVLSRRSVLAKEADAARSEAVGALAPGSKIRGKVTRIEGFGAFCEISPGLEGLLHVSNFAHVRVEDLSEHLKVGEELELMILDITEGGKRIGLGRKQLEPDPWDGVSSRFSEESVVLGKVTRLMDFGAFVELEPGVEGLVHVSRLDVGRTTNPAKVVSVGEELSVRVTEVDEHGRRLSLSRLDSTGALLGSDEAADAEAVREQLSSSEEAPRGLNLGALLKRAMDDEES
ncbi:MAG: S1 RNA-binding domain-containing protein [Planctomycetes bacterium]|nr:S1 RNA-binding domain-containing protein [Planctomycetota bacterium]